MAVGGSERELPQSCFGSTLAVAMLFFILSLNRTLRHGWTIILKWLTPSARITDSLMYALNAYMFSPGYSTEQKRRLMGWTLDDLTWVATGLFTDPLQLPIPAREFPAVSWPWDSKQFAPCLMIPGISSFSGTLSD